MRLVSLYKCKSEVFKFLKLPQVLDYVLAVDVVDLFKDLSVDLGEKLFYFTLFNQLCEFYLYFEKYYVGILPVAVVVSLKLTRTRC